MITLDKELRHGLAANWIVVDTERGAKVGTAFTPDGTQYRFRPWADHCKPGQSSENDSMFGSIADLLAFASTTI